MDNVISKLPKDTSLMNEYNKSTSNKLELEGTSSFILYNNMDTNHTVEIKCTVNNKYPETNVLIYTTDTYKITFNFTNKNGFNILEEITYNLL